MNTGKRGFLRSLAIAGAALPGWVGPVVARSEQGYPRLIQGLMMGAVTEGSAQVWMRVSGQFPAALAYGTRSDLSGARVSPAVEAEPARILWYA